MEMKARIRGVDYHMMTFDFFHGLALGEFLLRHTDSLSTPLQRPNLSAAEGQSITSTTVITFSNLRSELFSCFGLMSLAKPKRETLKKLHCQDAEKS